MLLADQEVCYFPSLPAWGRAVMLLDIACLNVVTDVSVGNWVEALTNSIVDWF